MIKIVLDEKQAESLANAREAIQLSDETGHLLGIASPTPQATDVEEAQGRLDSEGPWLTTEQVRKHLDSLVR